MRRQCRRREQRAPSRHGPVGRRRRSWRYSFAGAFRRAAAPAVCEAAWRCSCRRIESARFRHVALPSMAQLLLRRPGRPVGFPRSQGPLSNGCVAEKDRSRASAASSRCRLSCPSHQLFPCLAWYPRTHRTGVSRPRSFLPPSLNPGRFLTLSMLRAAPRLRAASIRRHRVASVSACGWGLVLVAVESCPRPLKGALVDR